ncbi:hypothetical protein FHR87_003184 [Azomonas macrocytogenes]|uniref:Uncharacterized protein n=1 Tax=Azomonas macrocytogenes TaxID=69962 RepID=A0A839T6N2_AZOMA|nr:hypothetical protein [Azomonas macrocytogenes]
MIPAFAHRDLESLKYVIRRLNHEAYSNAGHGLPTSGRRSR